MRYVDLSVDIIKKHSIVVLWMFLIVALVMHMAIVDIAPLHWQDEVQIGVMTHGGVACKDSLHSLVAMSDDGSLDRQAWALYWFGAWGHNFAYEMIGHAGPRIIQLLFLAALSVIVYGLAMRKTGDALFSLAMAVVVFAFPPINVSARSGRVDAQAILLILLAVYLVGQFTFRRILSEFFTHFIVGGLSAAAVFTWITSIVAMPIILCEFINESCRLRRSVRHIALLVVCMIMGGLAVLFLAFIPFLQQWEMTIALVNNVMKVNLDVGAVSTWHVGSYLRELSSMPGLCVLGVVLLFVQKRLWVAALGFVLFSIVCMRTKTYAFRTVYFLPYVLFAIIYFRAHLKSHRIRKFLLFILCAMAVIAFIRVVVIRSFIEPFARPARDYAKMKEILRHEIGDGPDVRIYVASHELGYISRDLGWNGDNYANGPGGYSVPTANFLLRDDYVIGRPEDINERFLQSIQEGRFLLWKTIPSLGTGNLSRGALYLKQHGKLDALGPYKVYRREDQASN